MKSNRLLLIFYLLSCSILFYNCVNKTILGTYISQNKFETDNNYHYKNTFQFLSNYRRFIYECRVEQSFVESKGSYIIDNDKIILKSDTDIYNLPFSVEQLVSSRQDSTKLYINITCNFKECYKYVSLLLEIDDSIKIPLQLKDDLSYTVSKNQSKIRFQLINKADGVPNVNEVFYSSILYLDKHSSHDLRISYDYNNHLCHYRTFRSDTLFIQNRKKLFFRKDSLYYYFSNKL